MFVVVFCSLIALLLTVLESKGGLKHGMLTGFILVTILGAIHYDYGNDYMSYKDIFKQVTSYSFNMKAILAKEYYHDPGWVVLCYLFKPCGGFFTMVAVLNIIQNTIVYNFIKTNLNKRLWPFAVFVYLFVTSFYLMSFSMMRQMFVMVVFLGTWKFIIKREWWIPLIVIYLCSFVHGSALILIPFAFWGFIPLNNAKYLGVVYVILLAVFWLFGNTLNNLFQFAMTMDDVFSGYVDTYENNDSVLKLGFGFIINMIPFVLSIIFLFSKGNTDQEKSLVALAAISFLITPFSQIIQLVGRLGSYFGIFSIVSIPLIYNNIKKKRIRNVLILLYLFISLYDYYLFFTDSVFEKKYSIFHTIFTQVL